MGKTLNWNWPSAIIGATAAAATTTVLSSLPKDPTFHLVTINLTSFKFSLPILDTEVILTVHVSNPNSVPINYSSTELSIFYAGSFLGSAPIKAGSQGPRSCEILHLTACLSGLEMAHHAAQFLADVAKREMVLDAAVVISGTAKVLWWEHKFKVHVDSHITVDPLFLDVIDQENKSEMELFVK